MYEKILKETAPQLTLLVIEDEHEHSVNIRKNLSHLFKETTYVHHAVDALNLYRRELFDLVLIDIDMLISDMDQFIHEIQKQDTFQSIAVYSDRIDDPVLLMKLINSHISGFFSKQSQPDEMYKILSKICSKTHDRKMLHHYIENMEGLFNSGMIQMKSNLIREVQLVAALALPYVEMDTEDDFEFFPLSIEHHPVQVVDDSMYQDYYSFLEHDDKEELADQLNEIDATLFNAFDENGGNRHYVSRLGTSFMRYGNVLLHYQFFSDMGASILELGKMIDEQCDRIVEDARNFELLISAFCSGLQTFMAEVWEKNSDNPKFFNDSIINDMGTILAMINPQMQADNDDDLVFF